MTHATGGTGLGYAKSDCQDEVRDGSHDDFNTGGRGGRAADP
jgi:hypothetical protein